MKQNGVFDDALRLSLFPYSLTHHAIAWYDRLPRIYIHSFDDMMRKFLSKYFPSSMVTKLRNEITKFEQKQHESLFGACERYKLSVDRCPNHNMLLVTQIDTVYKNLTLSHRDTINAAAGGTFMQKTREECYKLIKNMTAHHNHWDTTAISEVMPEWSRHVTIIHQTKDLHTTDYTQLYDFLKYNQKELDELKSERLAKTQDPLALMANSNNPYIAQLGMNMGQDRQMQMVGGNGGNQFRVQNVGNQNGLIGVQGNGNQNQIGNGNLVAARAKGNAAGKNGNQIRCYNCSGVGIQLQAEEYDLMAAAADLDEIEEVNAKCILMANLQQASTSGTQTDSAPVYDTDRSAEVHENCYDNEISNMFTQEEQYTELLKPIPESHQVPQNDNDVISEDTSMEQGGETVEQHPANFKETQETLQLAQESHDKMKQMNKEIKPANYTKINHLSRVFVSQKALSREELYFSNNSKLANVSKLFLIPNEDLLDDTTPSVARKFLNEVKSTILTLQRVVKQRMTIKTHNWASSAHQELHKIIRDENFPIVDQVDARLQNFKIQFLKEAAKFVGDFKSLANEANASLAKNKALELEIERLLKAVVS
nr:reverse transcriptase domain-containing protein [Tanacetum cinerariifolium]